MCVKQTIQETFTVLSDHNKSLLGWSYCYMWYDKQSMAC